MGRGTKHSPEEMKGLAQVLTQYETVLHQLVAQEISRRLTSNVDRKKAREWDKEKAQSYVALLSEHHAAGYLTEPEGIFNLDESGFILGYKRDRVYTEAGVKQAIAHTEGTTRVQVTVLFCGDATGRMLRPLVLYDGKVQLESMHRGTDDKLYVAVNDSGTMDADVLTDYFRKEVIANMTAQKNIVFMDGHHSHVLNVQLFTLCEKSEKDIQTFSGHMALLCTPLAHKFSFDFESVKAGFRKTGIFPFDPEAIRQTVDKTPTRNDQQQNPLLDKHHQSLQTIDVILRKGLNFDSEKVDSCLDSIVNVGTGHRTVAERIASAAGKTFAQMKPKKQRQLTDKRLARDRGVNLLGADYRSGIDDRTAAKAAKHAALVLQEAPAVISKKKSVGRPKKPVAGKPAKKAGSGPKKAAGRPKKTVGAAPQTEPVSTTVRKSSRQAAKKS
ncbi:hypothetical protein RvY_16197 [Ramazzottius varieornatus]|uniref:DDE-1 domain-containing protein n=1 Tax=Ramazzottius varieornatus TaxID=947166 RepID=A0A1D1VXL4_RAMVA|nr:hypothetical protein RvY_16197 [Ramazzottius varieornatus]